MFLSEFFLGSVVALKIPSDWQGSHPNETSSYLHLGLESPQQIHLPCLCEVFQPSHFHVPGSLARSWGFHPSGSYAHFLWLHHVLVWHGLAYPSRVWRLQQVCGLALDPTCGYWAWPLGSRFLLGGLGFHPIGCSLECVLVYGQESTGNQKQCEMSESTRTDVVVIGDSPPQWSQPGPSWTSSWGWR